MNSPKTIERQVGIFIFIGIIVTCAMILYFGKAGDRFRGGYPIMVEFSNAGGLVHGGQVFYAGVPVGKIDRVKLRPDNTGVEVELNIFEGVQIRKDAGFLIKQSGLLGDQHIVVVPHTTTAPVLQPGDRVKGSDPFDFSEAATQAGEAIKKLNAAIDKLSSDVLEGETMVDLKQTIKNFSDLIKKLQSNSNRLDDVLARAQKGQGTVGKLLTDDQLFEELKRLIHNWRVHGLLYREKAAIDYPSPPKGSSNKPYSAEE